MRIEAARGRTSLVLSSLFVAAKLASAAGAQEPPTPVLLRGPEFSVGVHPSGTLVRLPDTGLTPTWGPATPLPADVVEWWGLRLVDEQGVAHAGVRGAAPDWAGRTAMPTLSFEHSAARSRSTCRLGALRLEVVHEFHEDGRHLLVHTRFHNTGTTALREIRLSAEWRSPGSGGAYPPELAEALGPAAPELRRVAWDLGTLRPGQSTSLSLGYRAPAIGRSRGSEVPLRWLTTPNWPSGVITGLTNGVSWGDDDADGWPDFFVAYGVQMWRNLRGQDWRRLDRMQSQLDPSIYRYGSSFGDYDNDGFPDLGIEPRGPDMHLFRNLGGRANYELVSTDPRIVDRVPYGLSETLCWVDVDHDGDLDYFLPVYPPWGGGGPGNFFLHNLGPTGPGGAYRFTEQSVAAGLWNPPNTAKPEGAEACDVDFDGDVDLYSNGTLYQNVSTLDAPSFRWMRESASGILFSGDQDEGCAFFDYDMDGDEDLAIAYCLGGHGVRLFENRGDGTFFLAEQDIIDSHDLGLCLGLSKADWDNDGDIDFTTKEVFRLNQAMQGERRFRVATHSIPDQDIAGATPAWADWDRDGDLDALLGNYGFAGTLYENTTYDQTTPDHDRRSIRVRVVRDDEAVPRGLETEYGARVELIVEGEENRRRRVQSVSSSGGYLNQNEYALHFAVPPDPTPDDPSTDVRFDLCVSFPSDPSRGLTRVDRHVNAELGNIDFGALAADREIWVYRSGRVRIRDCFFPPSLGVGTVTTLTTHGLASATDTQPLPDPVPSPSPDWSVGLDLDTHAATGPLRMTEVLLDGSLDLGASCATASARVFLWDVSVPGRPELVESFDAEDGDRNRRHRYRANARLLPQRRYRLVARVRELRWSPINGPVLTHPITVNGGLSFQDLDPCSGAAVEAAVVDPTAVALSLRFAPDPGEIWADLGRDLPGSHGSPHLSGAGPMIAGSTVGLELRNGAPNQLCFLVIGRSVECVPFAGGRLIPALDHVLFPVTDAGGAWSLSMTWPAGWPEGDTTYFQLWFPDAGAVGGWAASNALSGSSPF